MRAAIPRICRKSRKAAPRYRARCAEKQFHAHPVEPKRKDAGVFMDSNHGPGAKAAVSSPPAHGATGEFVARRERRRAHGCKKGGEMKIILFPVKLDKFTGLFDKLLKAVCLATDCNHRGYQYNLSDAHSNPAVKKVYRLPRISPQQPASARASYMAARPPYPRIRNAPPRL